jgi:5-methylcytosine-specific restriction protein A
MPQRAKRPCVVPLCPELVDRGYCVHHASRQTADRRRCDTERGTSSERGYDARWRRERAAFIVRQFAAGHLLCPTCGRPFYNASDVEVDHKIPHRGNAQLFWDQSNWQMLHKPCHSAKTARGE